MSAPSISPASFPDDLEIAHTLCREYVDSLGVDLSFQDAEDELANLPRHYGPPGGRFLIARAAGQAVGCAALRFLDLRTCEMKRLYVRPVARGTGLGRRLAGAIIEAARKLGYARMRLDTLPQMREAFALYQSLGFCEIPAYRFNPVAGTRYLERDLV